MSTTYNSNYILVNGKVEHCPDIIKWGKWFSENDRTVIRTEKEGYIISTVFMGLDHSFGGGPPLLFESMVFKDETGGQDHDVFRYSTLEQAKEGHIKMCNKHLSSYTEEDLFLDIL